MVWGIIARSLQQVVYAAKPDDIGDRRALSADRAQIKHGKRHANFRLSLTCPARSPWHFAPIVEGDAKRVQVTSNSPDGARGYCLEFPSLVRFQTPNDTTHGSSRRNSSR